MGFFIAALFSFSLLIKFELAREKYPKMWFEIANVRVIGGSSEQGYFCMKVLRIVQRGCNSGSTWRNLKLSGVRVIMILLYYDFCLTSSAPLLVYSSASKLGFLE